MLLPPEIPLHAGPKSSQGVIAIHHNMDNGVDQRSQHGWDEGEVRGRERGRGRGGGGGEGKRGEGKRGRGRGRGRGGRRREREEDII